MIYSTVQLQQTNNKIKFSNSNSNININNNIINKSNNNNNNSNKNDNDKINIKTTSIMNPPPVKRRGGPREGAGRKRKNGPKALTYTPTPEVAQFLNSKKQCNESIQQIITRCILEFKMLEATDLKHRDEVSQLWSQVFTLEQNLCQCKQELKEYKEKYFLLNSLKHHRIESGNTDILISPTESSSFSTIDSFYNDSTLINVKTSTPISSVHNSCFYNENSLSAGENNIPSNNINNASNKAKGNETINHNENVIINKNDNKPKNIKNETININNNNQKHINFNIYNEPEKLFNNNLTCKSTIKRNRNCNSSNNKNNYSSDISFSSPSLIYTSSSSIDSSKPSCHKNNDNNINFNENGNKEILSSLNEKNNNINNNYYQISDNKIDNNKYINNNNNKDKEENMIENYKLFTDNIPLSYNKDIQDKEENMNKNYNNDNCYNKNEFKSDFIEKKPVNLFEKNTFYSPLNNCTNSGMSSPKNQYSQKNGFKECVYDNDDISYKHKNNQEKEKEMDNNDNYYYHFIDNNQQKFKKIKVNNNESSGCSNISYNNDNDINSDNNKEIYNNSMTIENLLIQLKNSNKN